MELTLAQRMKKGELYVVCTGLSDEMIHLVSFGDAKRTPRIYTSETMDSKFWRHTPICEDWATVQSFLSAQLFGVLIELPVIIEVFGLSEVRSWAKAQADPKSFRSYLKKFMS